MHVERTIHRQTPVIKLIFGYDKALLAQIRATIPSARWSQSMRCWYLPDTPQTLRAIKPLGFEAPAAQGGLSEAALSTRREVPDDTVGKHQDWLLRFAGYMQEERYSPRTIEAYTECLRIFFRFSQWKAPREIDNADVEAFNRDYILKNHRSATYQSQFISALKLFYAKIPRRRLIIEQLERPRRGRPLPKVISREEIACLLAGIDNLKHRAMLSLLYSCGLRRGELLELRIADIDSKRHLINIRHAKGDKDRQVPLSPKILDLLRGYFRQYRPQIYLFEGDQPSTPYAAESLHKVFTAAKKRAGITIPFKLHGLRHCYATHLMESGVGIRYIQELLGHRYLKTTEIYTHVSSEALRNIQSPFDTLDISTSSPQPSKESST